MSEPGDLSQAIVEEGGPGQDAATPENGVVKSESLDEEEKLELQKRLAAQNQERRKSKSGAGKGIVLAFIKMVLLLEFFLIFSEAESSQDKSKMIYLSPEEEKLIKMALFLLGLLLLFFSLL